MDDQHRHRCIRANSVARSNLYTDLSLLHVFYLFVPIAPCLPPLPVSFVSSSRPVCHEPPSSMSTCLLPSRLSSLLPSSILRVFLSSCMFYSCPLPALSNSVFVFLSPCLSRASLFHVYLFAPISPCISPLPASFVFSSRPVHVCIPFVLFLPCLSPSYLPLALSISFLSSSSLPVSLFSPFPLLCLPPYVRPPSLTPSIPPSPPSLVNPY